MKLSEIRSDRWIAVTAFVIAACVASVASIAPAQDPYVVIESGEEDFPSAQLPPPDEETFSESFHSELDDDATRKASSEAATLNLVPTGFLRSRWAMTDPAYAEKYANGARKTNLLKKIKQAADARFVRDFAGWYLSGGLTAIGDTPDPLGSIEIGVTGYQTSYLTSRLGFIAAANDKDFYVGGETGLRIQTPTRLAPFVGGGLFLGASSTRSPAEDDNVDNDDDGAVDEDGETEFDFDGALAAIYPEAGVHFWWSPRVRISGFGRYLITTEGRSADSWYYGVSMAILSR
ncbi:hypothetical protein K227x_55480 [Rubripirellula lacrimiformis]|uniref:Uncharacterized protein n=1 Tax=Rubripirellula lacrimiformis TaxID=1930273 RepID=A0A517NJB7_9BACT|nr:hypothetical protein [Rubripirellula lacrimiformis]QDT07123.1 hypothetical protein K227x_55480 [Rubripirellula lacrimiformis]